MPTPFGMAHADDDVSGVARVIAARTRPGVCCSFHRMLLPPPPFSKKGEKKNILPTPRDRKHPFAQG